MLRSRISFRPPADAATRPTRRVLTLLSPVLLIALVFVNLLTSPRAAFAQTLTWSARYNGPSDNDDGVTNNRCMAVDAGGNTYLTGYSLTNESGYDWLTVKYNKDGQQQWIARYNGLANSSDAPTAITADAQGGLYVTGYAYETPGSNVQSMMTIKYDSANGQQQWKQSYRGATGISSAAGQAIAVNPQQPNSVFVTGNVTNGVSSTSGSDFVTIRYDVGSGAKRWVTLYNGPDNSQDASNLIGADASGNCYVSGYSASAAGGYDYFTTKYVAATGQAVWGQRYNGSGNSSDLPAALVLDAQGNVSITGYAYSGASAAFDFATIKYNGTSGVPVWTQVYNNPAVNGTDMGTAIGADAAGNIYVSGHSDGGSPASGNTGDDYATIKYDADSGGVIWTARYDGGFTGDMSNRQDRASALTVDSIGNCYVTGSSYGGDPASGGSNSDIATVKYDRLGGLQWTRRYNSNDVNGDTTKNNSEAGQAIAQDAQGNIYVGGSVTPPGPSGDYLALKYSVGSVWSAQDIAVGSDNKTRFLWNRSDGAIALWTVTPAGVIEASKIYGPYAGLSARAIAVGSDNKVRLLWDGGVAKGVVWTLAPNLVSIETAYTFTPANYYPWEIAVGPTDNKTRISWYNAANQVAVWTLTGGSVTQSASFNAPSGGYIDQAIAVGADNRVRLVWNSNSLGKAALWTLNATTMSTIDSGYSYAQPNLFAADVATGADNKPRLLWTRSDGSAALWQISATSSAIEKGISLPTLAQPGWIPSHISYSGGAGSDGNVRLLWTAPTGAILLYTVDPNTGVVVKTTPFGPL